MASRSYEQTVLEALHNRLQSPGTKIFAGRWFLIALWIFLVLFQFLVLRVSAEGYLPTTVVTLLNVFVGVLGSFGYFYHTAERQWAFWAPHIDSVSIEERLNTIKKDAKAQ